MAMNVIVRYNGGFLPDILLWTQAPIFVWFDGTIVVYYYYPFNYVLQCLLFCYVWWLCMAINVSVEWASPRHYTVDPRLLPSGTRLNAM